LLVECGLSPLEAITAATSVANEALGLADDVGTIAPGQLGELLVIDGDPLADITLFQQPSHVHAILQSADPLTF
jgi:imidazolonepropionase-like amidohydrolase